MSTARKGRGLLTTIFRDFIKSFSVRKNENLGNYIGCDLNGNKFYENPAEPSRGMRVSRRSFIPEKEMHFDVSNMSAEWDAWLRHRRTEPPSIEELKANLAIAQMKQVNAASLQAKEGRVALPGSQKHSDMTDYPTYDEYEVNPGKNSTKFDS